MALQHKSAGLFHKDSIRISVKGKSQRIRHGYHQVTCALIFNRKGTQSFSKNRRPGLKSKNQLLKD